MTPDALAACAQIGGPVRPTFCNVPPWAQAFLYVAGAIAIGMFAYGTWQHARAWRKGTTTPQERQPGDWSRRASHFLRYVVGQQKTVERRLPAIFHTGLFWGFVLLFIGTVLATLDWDVAHLIFGSRFLVGNVYLVYEFVLEVAGIAFITGLFVAMWRRYFVQPHHVRGSWDFVLWLLLAINVTGFLVEGLRLAIAPVDWGGYSFVGQWIADALYIGGEPLLAGLAQAHLFLWMTHAVAALAFIAAIPYTNAVHMVNTPVNALLQPHGEQKPGVALVPIDIQNAEHYGVGELGQFTTKQLLSADSCLRCGRCETVCPAYMSGSPLNPKQIIVNLSEGVRAGAEMPSGAGAIQMPSGGAIEMPLIGVPGLIDPDALWGCTTCMACVEVCPAFIEIVDDIVDMRRHLALMEGTLPGTAAGTLRNMATAGNPWGYAPDDRIKWAEGLDVPLAKPGEHVEILYFVGCSGSYDKRNQKIARAVAQLMIRAGVKFAVMDKERCNAESARRLGEEYLYQTATEENVGNMNQLSFDRVVTHCPHCFNTIANEYGHFGGDYEVIHHTQLIRELVESGRLPEVPAAGAAATQQKVAFHDSCYLGRYNGEFQAPRDVLGAAGVGLIEMGRNRENGLCCGGGGGKMWFEAPQATSVGQIRMTEALEHSPDVVGVACPFCLTMLDSAKSSMGASEVKIMDVSEVYLAALDGTPANEGD